MAQTLHLKGAGKYSFTPQFLKGAALFARQAEEIEKLSGSSITERKHSEHMALVIAAIMQSVGTLESEVTEVVWHGPGHQLGSGGIDHKALAILLSHVKRIEDKPLLQRYNEVLRLLNKPLVELGKKPAQETQILIDLRHELSHYKAQWENETEPRTQNRIRQLEQLLKDHKPPFVSDSHMFFPFKCLSAWCARWSVEAVLSFLGLFFSNLGVKSPVAPHQAEISAILNNT